MRLRTSLIITALWSLALGAISQQTYVVNALDDVDDGNCDAIHCSLREAMNAANADMQPSTIEFSIGTGQTETILLDNALPILEEDSTTIDGMTQTGNPGGVRIDCGNIGAQQLDIIRIHGNHTNIYGLEIFNYTVSEDAMTIGAGSLIGIGGIFVLASPSTVRIGAPDRGNILHSVFRTRSTAANYGNGIAIHSGTEIIIQGNRIGTNYDADTPLEVYGEGIRVDENNFGETQIGGTGPDEGNIIGSCFNGIGIYGGDGWMRGNHIGISRDLQTNLSNRNSGISIRDGDYYQIGGTVAEEGNFIYNNITGVDIISNSNQYVGYNEIAFNSEKGILTTACADCLFQFNRISGSEEGITMSDGGIQTLTVTVRFNEIFENGIGAEYFFNDASRDMPITQNSFYCHDVAGIAIWARQSDPFDPISFNSISNTQVVGLATPGARMEIFEIDTTGCPDSDCYEGKVYLGATTADPASGLWSYNDVFSPGRTYSVTQTITRRLTSPFTCFQIPECTTVVTTPADVGAGSLREAIICANANPGPDTITFDIIGGVPRTISPMTLLPALTDDSTVIDATTQPGNSPMNQQITIDCGNLSGLGTTGLRIEGDYCEVYGLVISNSEGSGIIAGRDIDPINHFVLGGPERDNILVDNDQFGVNIQAGRNVRIQSNFFGTSPAFSPPFRPTGRGCSLTLKDTSRNILVGGDNTLGQSNFFGFCEEVGCEIIGGAPGPVINIEGNFFGTDRMGMANAPNGNGGTGRGALSVSDANCHVGDGSLVRANVFAFNRQAGVFTEGGDHLINNNSFICNTGGGIDNTSSAQTGNPQVTAPEITNANNTLIRGTSQGSGTIEVYFHDDSQCQGVPCQGATLLGVALADPASGDWSLTGPFIPALNIGDLVTATFSNDNQTSEFSQCVQVCPDLIITAMNNGPVCPGDSVMLEARVNTSSSDIEYIWTGPNNFTSSDSFPSGILDPGIYEVVVIVDGCEYASQMTEVTILTGDTIRIDSSICSSDFVIIGGERFDRNRPAGQVILNSSSGCDSVINVMLNVGESTMDTIRSTLCGGEFVEVNGTRYDRNNPNGREIMSGSGGCDSVIVIDLSFFGPAINTIDRELCFGDDLVINNVVYNENNPSGIDTLTGASVNGCDSIIQVDLSFGAARVYDLDTTLCPKGSIMVNGILYDQFYMMGTDTIFGGSSNGCDSVINVTIRYPDPAFDLDTILPNCDGSQEGQIVINNISGISSPFQYSLNGSPFSSIQGFPWTINALDEGSYDIIFIDGKDCRHLVQLMLASTGSIDFSVQSPVSLTLGDSAILTYDADFDPDSVIWKDQEGNVVCGNCDEITVTPGSNTSYSVTIYKDGCSAMRTITVEVDGDVNVFVPNIFSPDGDGINDKFNIYSDVPGVIVERLNIYDRWGELIYSGLDLDASSFNQGWDGTYDGEPVNPGVYVYHFKVLVPGGRTENYKGSVTIIR